MSLGSSAPLAQGERIKIIDVVRGVALLGILMMNIPYFSNPEIQASNLNVHNEYSGPDYYTWWAVEGLFEGTMRALFSMLFGAGCLLLLDRLAKNSSVDPAEIYYRRLLWMFLFGMVDAFILLWPGDILYVYAICGLFLYPFKKMKARHLFMIAMVLMLCINVKATYRMWTNKQTRVKGEAALALESKKQTLSEQQKEDKQKWLGMQQSQTPEGLQRSADKDLKGVHQGYFGVLAYYSSVNADLQGDTFYHWRFLDSITLIFLGMALFRWGVLTGQRSRKFYWILLLCAYGIGLPLSYYEHSTLVDLRFDPSRTLDRFHFHFYEERRTLLGLGHMALVILLYQYGVFGRLWRWMSRVGQMAFSNYLMQSIICGVIFYGFGFGLFGKLQRYEEYYVVGALWVFQIAFSNIWLHYYRFGPLEWVWRSLTYWKKQPMKRSAEPSPALVPQGKPVGQELNS